MAAASAGAAVVSATVAVWQGSVAVRAVSAAEISALATSEAVELARRTSSLPLRLDACHAVFETGLAIERALEQIDAEMQKTISDGIENSVLVSSLLDELISQSRIAHFKFLIAFAVSGKAENPDRAVHNVISEFSTSSNPRVVASDIRTEIQKCRDEQRILERDMIELCSTAVEEVIGFSISDPKRVVQ
jgi:hypothetical protein